MASQEMLAIPPDDSVTTRIRDDADSRSSRRLSRGARPSTYQTRLAPQSRSPVPSSRSVGGVGTKEYASGLPLDNRLGDGVDGGAGSLAEKTFGAGENFFELQPRDGGFGAWSYVAAAFSMYIVVWGFPQAFPIFQTYLSTGPDATFPNSIAIRLLAPGLQDIEEGILFPLLPRPARYRKPLVILGIFVMVMSLVLAANCTKDWQIVLTQGVSFGAGGILLNFVHVSIFPEWFDEKKGQAMGIIWTGWRVGSIAFPLICQALLDEHGFRKTIYVLIPPILSLLVPAVLLLRGRYHGASVAAQPPVRRVSKRQALQTPSVLYYLFATSLFFLVINVPKMFITTFAADVGLSRPDQALALVCLTVSDMLGTYLLGWLSDTVHHEILTASLAITTSLFHVLGLGFAKTKPGVFVYGIAVGLASGGFSNCLFTFYGDLSRGDSELFTAIHGLFSFFRGAAILSVGPVGAELLNRAPPVSVAEFAIARYRYLLAYAAASSFFSGLLILSKFVGRRLKKAPPKP